MFYDVAIIGAGPCGLSVAARLREQTPSALFTNDEHARYWRKHKQAGNTIEKEHKKRKPSTDSGYGSEVEDHCSDGLSRLSMIVLEANSDQWMTIWKQRFNSLKISHLRSPLFFHPDPRDRDGLLGFAHEQGRIDELREIPNVVGKELSKHEKKRQHSRKQARTTARHLRIDGRDQIDYFTPSSELFDDYCNDIIDRYRLRNLVQEAKITNITYDAGPADLNQGLFTLTTSNQDAILARTVIVATGASSTPSIPNLHQLPAPLQHHSSITHVFAPNGTHLPPHTHQKLKSKTTPTNILIIGGGLTSAQLAHLFLSTHPQIHIHLLLRHNKLKCKPFDIDLPWVSKTRNQLMSIFWSADTDAERLSMLRAARNGGSINPPFGRILQNHISEGRVSIHTDTTLTLDAECIWDDAQKLWTHLNIQPPPSVSTTKNFPFAGGIDHIVYCTGATPNVHSIPFLSSLGETRPIETLGGLPMLNEDLQWNDDVPLFFTGALAALRLGPGAANLAGARQGAERIAWSVEEVLARGEGVGKTKSVDLTLEMLAELKDHMTSGDRKKSLKARVRERSEFTGSFSNQFGALEQADED